MNPDFLPNSGANFRFDAFDEAHADPSEFIGRPDRGGNFQRCLFHLAPAQVRSGVDAFECVRHFSCFHNLLFGCVADSFNDPTILSDTLLANRKLSNRSLEKIERNHCRRRGLTQKRADFMRGDLAGF
jgi:hypothetical protein